ncbi:MAG: flavin reductase family protein [Gammaproteobacteria bacterium]|nr:flavin reductase family protein [Gammaproteobacteria bacterium]MDH4253582.1 flavin reductase family protein [Gammaproteobacteria bacterium]MDH5310167.1 flavin reductase family protein [Gammaproteobacteria bacterium]
MQDPKKFRRSLGRFATGVTVATCTGADGEPFGLTVNSFSSVSLEPPLVLWNIAKVSRSLEAFLEASHFGVNVLARDQRDLAAHFARSATGLFEGISFHRTGHGVPLLDSSLAWFECRSYQRHDCGDHYILVGEVIAYDAADGDPLLFYRGDYAVLSDG